MKKYEPNSFSWLAIMLTIFYIARRTRAGVLHGVDIIVCSVVVLGCILYLLNYTINILRKIVIMNINNVTKTLYRV